MSDVHGRLARVGTGLNLVGEPSTVTGASLELVRGLEGAAIQVWRGLVRGSLHECALAGEKALPVVRWSHARERD